MFGLFGLLALAVAALGVYGVIGYDVTQRMHELGIRIALGAQAGHVLRIVTGRGARLTALGVVIGAGLSLAAARWLQPLLFEQSATDPRIYASVAAVMLGASLTASLGPAWRATRADPNQALRDG